MEIVTHPSIIRLAVDKKAEIITYTGFCRLAVDNETVCEFLEGFTLDEALELNKMFVCDLQILDGVKCKDDRIVSICRG